MTRWPQRSRSWSRSRSGSSFGPADATVQLPMRGVRRSVATLASVALLAAACQATGPEPTPGFTEPGASAPATGGATQAPAPTVSRTPIPGFEGWETINPQAVRISLEPSAADDEHPALKMELVGSMLWFNTERGVLFGKDVTGAFRATATVRTTKTSDRTAAPGGNGSIQLAGLMAHATGR